MNISQRVQKWGGLASAVIAVVLLGDKIAEWLPDSAKPASKQFVADTVEPIQQDTKASLYQLSVEGIAWAHAKQLETDSSYTPEYLREQLCGSEVTGFEGYYRIYKRATGTKHERDDCDG